MKIISTMQAGVMLFALLALSACQSQSGISAEAEASSASSYSHEELAQIAKIPRAHGFFVLEGDILVRDTNFAMAASGYEVGGERTDQVLGKTVALTINDGVGAFAKGNGVIDPSKRSNFRYCFDVASFGVRFNEFSSIFTGALNTWSSHIGITFTYVPSQNTSCHGANPNIELNIVGITTDEPWAGRASYPDPFYNSHIFFNMNTPTEVIRGVALHELGHVFGFSHEHVRNEEGMPYKGRGGYLCGAGASEKTGVALTGYDVLSIMHYSECGDARIGVSELSAADIAGAMKIYPKPPHPYTYLKITTKDLLNDQAVSDNLVQTQNPALTAAGDFNNDSQEDLVTVSGPYLDVYESVYQSFQAVRLKRYQPAGIDQSLTPIAVHAFDDNDDGMKDIIIFYTTKAVVFRAMYPSGFAAGEEKVWKTTCQLRQNSKIVLAPGAYSSKMKFFVVQPDSLGIIYTTNWLLLKKPLPSGLVITNVDWVRAFSALNLSGHAQVADLLLLVGNDIHLFRDDLMYSMDETYAKQSSPISLGIYASDIQFGDFLVRDGHLDISVQRGSNLFILRNTGIDFQLNPTTPWFTLQQITLNKDFGHTRSYKNLSGDFDGDGLTDLAKVNATGMWIIPSMVGYNTTVPFTLPGTGYSTFANWSATALDINGDGFTDIFRGSPDVANTNVNYGPGGYQSIIVKR